MASLYTAELFAAHELTSELVSIPTNERWVIRTAWIFSAGLGGGAWMQIQRPADSLTLYELETKLGLFDEFAIDNEIRVVLMEGADYTIKAGSAPDVALYGYALSAP